MLLFEQRDRLKATNKFIYTGKYKKKNKQIANHWQIIYNKIIKIMKIKQTSKTTIDCHGNALI